jgi:hypothetical protein
MRKRLIKSIPPEARFNDNIWLDLDRLAAVEVTSEDPEYPIECALVPGQKHGWRAAEPGCQTIRIVLDEPQRIARIALIFEETDVERTQEFVLRWSDDAGHSFKEIIRQQWNFSPQSTREAEEYEIKLSDVTILELVITPDISKGLARATLKSLRTV